MNNYLKSLMELAINSDKQIFTEILQYYYNEITNLSQALTDSNLCYTITIPIIPINVLLKLICHAINIFQNEPSILHLKSTTIIVGDLHGHILDLFRILNRFGFPPGQTYLFLGDLVDRGQFSTEVATIVFLMKVLFPGYVYIIRGNHEFSALCQTSGFSHEIQSIYNNSGIQNSFIRAFTYIPLCAIIGNSTFCVHGGIGPQWTEINQIAQIKRPFDSFEDDIISAALWSDPDDSINHFEPSTRGEGYLFGEQQISHFLSKNNLSVLIRGHECVENGIRMSLGNKVITVFSASNYCGFTNNLAGVLIVHSSGQREPYTFQPIKYLFRNEVLFSFSEDENHFKPIVPVHPMIRSRSISARRKNSLETKKPPVLPNCVSISHGKKQLSENKILTHQINFPKRDYSPFPNAKGCFSLSKVIKSH